MFSPFKSLLIVSRSACCLAILTGLIAISGCGSSTGLNTKYGKVNEQPHSINSTSLFAKRLEDLDYQVTVRNRISPKINDFNIVFWFPESSRCPSDSAVKAIEEWSNANYEAKTLVYVGGDYRADEDYYHAIQKSISPELKSETQRLVSEAQLATQTRKNQWGEFGWIINQNRACDWFDLEAIKRKRSNLLAGPMASEADFDSVPELPIEFLMSPNNAGPYKRWKKESLLTVDGEDMVYRLTEKNYSDFQIIVVQNASFLVNFALADPDKQALADQLIVAATDSDNLSGYGYDWNVLILESEGDIPIRSTDFVNENSWAWIAEAPLCYIIPHALVWGVLFCFVYFPIFGRPKRLPKRSTTSFRNHINAVAKQLSRSGGKAHAHRTIEHYQESLPGSNKKNN